MITQKPTVDKRRDGPGRSRLRGMDGDTRLSAMAYITCYRGGHIVVDSDSPPRSSLRLMPAVDQYVVNVMV